MIFSQICYCIFDQTFMELFKQDGFSPSLRQAGDNILFSGHYQNFPSNAFKFSNGKLNPLTHFASG